GQLASLEERTVAPANGPGGSSTVSYAIAANAMNDANQTMASIYLHQDSVQPLVLNWHDGGGRRFSAQDYDGVCWYPLSGPHEETMHGQAENERSLRNEQQVRPVTQDRAPVADDSKEPRNWKTLAMLSILVSMPMIWIVRPQFRREW